MDDCGDDCDDDDDSGIDCDDDDVDNDEDCGVNCDDNDDDNMTIILMMFYLNQPVVRMYACMLYGNRAIVHDDKNKYIQTFEQE